MVQRGEAGAGGAGLRAQCGEAGGGEGREAEGRVGARASGDRREERTRRGPGLGDWAVHWRGKRGAPATGAEAEPSRSREAAPVGRRVYWAAGFWRVRVRREEGGRGMYGEGVGGSAAPPQGGLQGRTGGGGGFRPGEEDAPSRTQGDSETAPILCLGRTLQCREKEKEHKRRAPLRAPHTRRDRAPGSAPLSLPWTLYTPGSACARRCYRRRAEGRGPRAAAQH